jgi:hypothetical protein
VGGRRREEEEEKGRVFKANAMSVDFRDLDFRLGDLGFRLGFGEWGVLTSSEGRRAGDGESEWSV